MPADLIGLITSRTTADDLGGPHTTSIAATVVGLLFTGSAVALTMIIRKVGEWQLEPKTA